MFTPSSPAVVEPAAGAADARADGPPVDAAAAERLGLLPLLREASADDDATLKRAVAFLEKEGARSLADVAKYGLAEEFVEALLLTGRVSRAKLQDEQSSSNPNPNPNPNPSPNPNPIPNPIPNPNAKLQEELGVLARQGEGLVARVGRLRAALSLPMDPAELSLQAAVRAGTEQLGLEEHGPLQAQVERLLGVLGVN